jgi:PAS domain-containing protein
MEKGATRLEQLAGLMSAQINAQRATVADEAQVRRVLDTLPVVAWTADTEGNVTFFNRAFHEFCADDYDYRSRLHPDDVASHKHRWAESVRLERKHLGRSRIMGRDGNYHLMVTTAIPMRDEAGNVAFWVGNTTIVADVAMLDVRAA